MKRFEAIEGLRGWLAWTVVLGHVTYVADVYAKGLGPIAEKAGIVVVMVFIIISGFVITHLLLEKHERYGAYILRRFMRIFPLFAVTCVLGYFCVPLIVRACGHLPWEATDRFNKALTAVTNGQRQLSWPLLFAHLTMLHGAINTHLLPHSLYAFNPPAWSLSLEWQFYLIAPLVLAALRRASTAVILLAAFFWLCVAYNFGAFGIFEEPSILFAASPYFAIGIASRVLYPHIVGKLKAVAVVVALCVAVIPLGGQTAPFAVWGAVYALLIRNQSSSATRVDEACVRWLSKALEGPAASFVGKRSYSIYLCHMSVIGVISFSIIALGLTPSPAGFFLWLLISSIPLTFAVSCLFYTLIEKPGIALGNRAARHFAAKSQQYPEGVMEPRGAEAIGPVANGE